MNTSRSKGLVESVVHTPTVRIRQVNDHPPPLRVSTYGDKANWAAVYHVSCLRGQRAHHPTGSHLVMDVTQYYLTVSK